MVHNVFANCRAQLGHALGEPQRHRSAMKGQVPNPERFIRIPILTSRAIPRIQRLAFLYFGVIDKM